MKTMLTWCACNRVAANFFMLMIFMAGFTSVAKIQRELFPQVSLDTVSVSVLYPGATPVEVEEGIVVRIEEAISGLEGIEEINAIAAEGVGTVNVKVEPGYSTARLLDQVKTRVDAISTFPLDAEKPVVEELTAQIRVINVVISGDAVDELTLRRLADRAREDLLSLEGITQVQYGGLRPYEIAIHVSEAVLRRHGLTFDEVAAAVRRSSLDLPAGAIRAGSGDILVRTRSQAYRGHEFENLVVIARPDGTRLLLKDVAEVVDGFDENEQWARFNGRPAAMLSVMSATNQNVTDTAAAVHAYVRQAAERLPEGVEIDSWFDMSRWYVERQDLMLRNGLSGLVLVFLALSLFMHLRLAFWVASGMAVAFVGTFAVMILTDVSFNMISMAAFILVLGIVVDDAIVVAEAVHHWHTQGSGGTEGAVAGVLEVATPVIFAVLTTVIAFTPMLAISGVDGKFWRAIPIVIISCLLVSLVESLFILPAHLSHKPGHKIPWYLLPIWPVVWFSEQAQEQADRALQGFIDRVYRPFLNAAISWRYLTLAVFVGMLILMVGLIAGGRIRSAFFPRIPGDYATAALEMPEGTSAAATRRVLDRIEAAAFELRGQLEDDQPAELPVFRHVLVAMGSQPITRAHESMEGNLRPGGSHLAEVAIEFKNLHQRGISSQRVAEMWREKVGLLPGVRKLSFTGEAGAERPDVHLALAGRDLEQVALAAGELKKELTRFAGVYEISDTLGSRKPEITLAIKPHAEALGLRAVDLARQVRQAFYGEEAQRIQRGRDDVRVIVRYPPDERRSVADLENVRIRTAAGDEVPLGEVAEVEHAMGVPPIRRVDRNRVIDVTAMLDRAVVSNPDGIMADLKADFLPGLLQRYPGIAWSIEGGMEDQQRVIGELTTGFALAMFAMYALMAIAFKSYLQPMLIMLVIPFGLIGAVGGHILTHQVFSIISFLGVVALAGVVVNDSIVLIDAINHFVREGVPVGESVRMAARRRFRAILLTSLTTFLGLTPLMLETSVQAQFIVPMGVALAFGVAFSTVVTLILIPALYLMLEDGRGLWTGITARKSTGDESPSIHEISPRSRHRGRELMHSG